LATPKKTAKQRSISTRTSASMRPKAGEKIKIPATTVPKFSAGAGFKTAVAGKKKK
jgi:DNA-binding protein HU-beta